MTGEVTLPVPPYSEFASPEMAEQYAEAGAIGERYGAAIAAAGGASADIAVIRALVDEHLLIPGLRLLREEFDVTIESREIGGVRVDAVRPAGGVVQENAGRVLVNLHGGGLSAAAVYGAQQESVPIAALGGIEVLAVDYRMAPEHGFPAASEDLAAVYRALLETHAPEDIGLYGCSAGGYLVSAAMAWFESVGLPLPGAIGVFSAPATGDSRRGDGWHIAPFFRGARAFPMGENGYFAGADVEDPRVSPVLHPDLLSRFPPTLLLAGTRDIDLSPTVHLHAQLVAAGVDARLHVWEGTEHCSFAQGWIRPDARENRQAWDVIVRFFAQALGGRS